MDKDKNVVHELVLKNTPESFEEIVRIVENARERAYRRVNEELILMYLEIGKYLSEKSKEASYGSNYIENIADFFAQNYPDLKASTNFINLQDELAGTENRISTARRDYNNAVKSYNAKIKKIPTNIIASISGFDEKEYFEASEEKKEVPEVNFN